MSYYCFILTVYICSSPDSQLAAAEKLISKKVKTQQFIPTLNHCNVSRVPFLILSCLINCLVQNVKILFNYN